MTGQIGLDNKDRANRSEQKLSKWNWANGTGQIGQDK